MPVDKTYPEFAFVGSIVDSDLAVGWRASNDPGEKNIQTTWAIIAAYTQSKIANLNVSGNLRYGSGNTVSTSSSFAGGTSSTSSAANAFAVGDNAQARGLGSFAFGKNTDADQNFTFAGGEGSSTGAAHAFSFGNACGSFASASITIGEFCFANGEASIAMGSGTNSEGVYSVALGNTNLTIGEASFAMGQSNRVDSKFGIVFGLSNKNDSYASLVLGRFNATTGTKTTWVATDLLFQGGNGTSDGSRSNAFTLLKNGKFALGPALPLTNENDLLLNVDGVLAGKETTTPTADTNFWKLYSKADNKIYFQDGAGVEHEIAFV